MSQVNNNNDTPVSGGIVSTIPEEQTVESMTDNQLQEIHDYKHIPIVKLRPRRNHLFPPLDNIRHEDFKANIDKNGVREAIIVRPVDDIQDYSDTDRTEYPEAEYEVLSGHKRLRAVTELGLLTIKAEIKRGLKEDEASDIEIGSNVDRESFESLPYSVQAKILKERWRILTKEKKNTKKEVAKSTETTGEMEDKSTDCQFDNLPATTNEQLGEEYDIDKRKIAKLLRMQDKLNSKLFDKLDKDILPLEAAYNLSSLLGTEQEMVNTAIENIMNKDVSFKVPIKMSEILKSEINNLSQAKVDKILNAQSSKGNGKAKGKGGVNKKNKPSDSINTIDYLFPDGKKSRNEMSSEIKLINDLVNNTIPELVSDYYKNDSPTEDDTKYFVDLIKIALDNTISELSSLYDQQ